MNAEKLARLGAIRTEADKVEAEKLALIVELREAGVPLEAIAQAYGTNKVTVMRWANRYTTQQ